MNISWKLNAEEQYHIHIECANNALKTETIESLLESDKRRNSIPHERLPSKKVKRVRFSLSTDVRLIPGLRHDEASSYTPKKSKNRRSNDQNDVELQLAIQLSLGTPSLGYSVFQGPPGYPGISGTYGSLFPEVTGYSESLGAGYPGTSMYQGYPGVVETQGPSGYPGVVETGMVGTMDIEESFKHTLRALREDEKREERRGLVLVECPVCSIKKKSKRINQHLEDYHGFN